MKTISTLLKTIALLLILAPATAQTYNITANRNWQNGNVNAIPTPCYSCTINISTGVTLTIEKDVTLQGTTINGGNIKISGKKITLWGSSSLKTNFNNTKIEFKGASGITGSAPMIMTNSEFTLFNTAFLNPQWELEMNNSRIFLNDNTNLTATGPRIDLKTGSKITIGDGNLTSKAYIYVNGSTLSLFDNISGLVLANKNNYYFNWSTYRSVGNNRSHTTTNNNMNCGAGNPNSCSPAYVYGPVAFGSAGIFTTSVLPVKITSFTAAYQANGATQLTWTTAQELNANYFSIERSVDGVNFSSIGSVNAAGTSSSAKNYSFTDKTFANGTVYYRLRIVDLDGTTEFSDIRTVKTVVVKGVKVFPNPSTDYVNISLDAATSHHVQLINQFGQVIREQKAANASIVTIPVGQVSNGNYVIKVTDAAGNTQSIKLMVNHL